MSFGEEEDGFSSASPREIALSAPLKKRDKTRHKKKTIEKGFVFGMWWKTGTRFSVEEDGLGLGCRRRLTTDHTIDYQFKFTDRRGRDYRKSMSVDI